MLDNLIRFVADLYLRYFPPGDPTDDKSLAQPVPSKELSSNKTLFPETIDYNQDLTATSKKIAACSVNAETFDPELFFSNTTERDLLFGSTCESILLGDHHHHYPVSVESVESVDSVATPSSPESTASSFSFDFAIQQHQPQQPPTQLPDLVPSSDLLGTTKSYEFQSAAPQAAPAEVPLPNGTYPAMHSRSNSFEMDWPINELPDLSQFQLPDLDVLDTFSLLPDNVNSDIEVPVQSALPSISEESPSLPSILAAMGTKEKQPFQCPHCSSSFRIRGYLTRHIKKHATQKAYSCPFFDPLSKSPCHPSGGFSRRDTYKTHLKARHFLYPAGTRSQNRSKVSGLCGGCGCKFDSNEHWVELHIHNGNCIGLRNLRLKMEFESNE